MALEDKSPKIINIMDAVAKKLGGPGVKNVASNICALCGKEANKFKDELSKKEFSISKMCQQCQDDFWGKDE